MGPIYDKKLPVINLLSMFSTVYPNTCPSNDYCQYKSEEVFITLFYETIVVLLIYSWEFFNHIAV